VVAGWQVLVAQFAARAAADSEVPDDDGDPLAPPPSSGSPEPMAT